MSGVPLGQRTGSNGSLQLHIQNNVLLQNHGAPIVLRKPSKVLLPVSREKEKSFSRMFKFTGRRGFGMLLLVVISVVVCMSILSAICKDEVAPEGALFTHDVALEVTDLHHRITLDLLNNTSERVSLDRWEAPQNVKRKGNKKITGDQMKDKSSTLLNILPVNDAPPGHPCQSFAFPPPPADKKRTGPRPCPVCYLPVEEAIMQMPSVPSKSPVLENLTYAYEETPVRTVPFGGSDFGGYPSLEQRNESFDIKGSMNVHCGFVKGHKPGRHTGFDIDDADLFEMDQCRGVVVASAIFGNYDIIQQPKNISEAAKENVCFYMFLDEETEASIINSSVLEDRKKIGLWRIVVVRNLPYVDARRTGKVPKLLLHRMFPNARYSLWIDGKLELVVDPYQILERFLWRSGATFAISRHYKRFDVFVEAEANKAAGKYDNSSIDFQVDFYKAEGLTPYSVAKLPLTSDVPEGCVIIREHIPITNLFTCLWFNEVDRFTSRDQISFSTVRDKIMAKVDWRINMFMDCERRNFVVQAYHKDVLDHMSPPPPSLPRPKPAKALAGITTINIPEKTPARKSTPKRGRDRRSKRHRKTAAGSRDSNSIQFL